MQLENENRASLEAQYPLMKVLVGEHERRRVSKTVVWDLYWRINDAKCWLYYCHCYISTSRDERDFASVLENAWKHGSDPLIRNTSYLIHI